MGLERVRVLARTRVPADVKVGSYWYRHFRSISDTLVNM